MNAMREVTSKNRISYGIGDFYGGGAFFIIGALFLIFLTDIIGLKPILAGTVILVGKVWDAVTDPAMGFISDQTKSRYGRRRIYFLTGILPVALTFILLWVKIPIESETFKFIYYTLLYMLFSTAFTMVMVPYNAMPAEMTKSYGERSKLMGVRMFFSQIGAFMGALIPMGIVKRFEVKAYGYGVMGLAFGIVYGLCFWIVFKGTFESARETQEEKVPLRQCIMVFIRDFRSTFRNKSLRVHIVMFLTVFVAMDIFNALLIYMVRDFYEMEAYYQLFIGAALVFQVASIYMVIKECSKHGNSKTYRRHVVIWLISALVIGLLGKSIPLVVLVACCGLVGVGLCGAVMVPYNMLAFVTDADELISTKRREGIYSGAMTFLRKIAQAIALFGVSLGLEAVGYVGGEKLDHATLQGLQLMFVLVPCIFILGGLVESYKNRLNPKNHKILMEEISRLKSGGLKKDVESHVKIVCEEITGLNYSELWQTKSK